MVWMLFMVSRVLISVEYLHSLSCRHLLHLYVASSTRVPLEFSLYPIALMISGLRCFGLLCFGVFYCRLIVL